MDRYSPTNSLASTASTKSARSARSASSLSSYHTSPSPSTMHLHGSVTLAGFGAQVSAAASKTSSRASSTVFKARKGRFHNELLALLPPRSLDHFEKLERLERAFEQVVKEVSQFGAETAIAEMVKGSISTRAIATAAMESTWEERVIMPSEGALSTWDERVTSSKGSTMSTIPDSSVEPCISTKPSASATRPAPRRQVSSTKPAASTRPVVSIKREVLLRATSTRRARSGRDKSVSTTQDSQEEYEVETILAHKVVGGVYYFRIKWVGYSNSHCSWLPQRNLDGCKRILRQYASKHKLYL